MNYTDGFYSISQMRPGISKRVSSYDRTGGNKDYYTLSPNSRTEICDIKGSGYIRHIWMTMMPEDSFEIQFLPRKVIIRIFWDDEKSPSIEAPIGDFFGMGHGITKNYSSAFLMMSPEDGKAFNCFFPMPFSDSARIEIESQAEYPVKFYFYIDYEKCSSIPDNELRFHARWNRQCPTDGISDKDVDNAYYEFGGKNKTGAGNYVILEAKGKGHYVGCNYNLHNLRFTNEWNWYGEGDDMIFIDGENLPSIHGTGTEDYFDTAWCPQQEVCTPYHGIILGGGPNWSGKVSLYRYHILDPIIFDKSIKVTIEHGNNNNRCDDISSTAYWYQTEPHDVFKPILPLKERLPLPDILPFNDDTMKKMFGYPNP